MSKTVDLKQFFLAQVRSLNVSTQFNCQKTFRFQAIQLSQTVLIQTIQFSISTQVVLFNPLIGPYQVLSFLAKEDLGEMAMMVYSEIPQSPRVTGTSPLDCLVLYQDTL